MTETDTDTETDSATETPADSTTDTPADSTTPSAGQGAAAETRGEPTTDLAALLEREGDIAADYLEELLDIADLDGDLDMDVEGDRASVSIVGGDLSRLVGRTGEVLEALQDLARLAVLRETGERSRLMLDVGGHRARRRTVLEGIARDAVDKAKATGERVALTPMTAFERKVVHDVVAAAGLESE